LEAPKHRINGERQRRLSYASGGALRAVFELIRIDDHFIHKTRTYECEVVGSANTNHVT
jgi:hypothetical protein